MRRVAEAFADDGYGVRGNMKHVIRTILTDPETIEPSNPETFGKLKDPVVRLINLDRIFPPKLSDPDHSDWPGGLHSYDFDNFLSIKQEPLNAPHVFNFYSPFYSPKGNFSDNELVAPAFQLFDMQTAIRVSNLVWNGLMFPGNHWTAQLWYDDENGDSHRVSSYEPDYEDYLGLADTPEDLVDRLDLLLCNGKMTANTRRLLEQRIGQIDHGDDDDDRRHRRVAYAAWYISNLPEFIVEN